MLRVACIVIGHTYRVRVIGDHFDFGFEGGRIARSLVEGHGYANPFNGVSGPTAWIPPLYPLLLALSFKLFGVYTNAAAFFVMTVDSLFSALIAPAVYEIAARCFDANGIARRASTKVAPVALWAGWLWALYPAALQFAVHWLWDTSLSAFLFAWTVVLALRLRGTGEEERDGEAQWGRWAAFGALWGLVALSNASILIGLPAMGLWVIWPKLRALQLARVWAGPLVAVIALAAVMMPWWLRNERTLHAFVATRSNFGAELYESTLPSHDGYPWGPTLPMWPGDPKFQLYVHMGELPYSAMRKQQAVERIRENPKQIAKWTVDRFLFFWDNVPHPLENHPHAGVWTAAELCLPQPRRVDGVGARAAAAGAGSGADGMDVSAAALAVLSGYCAGTLSPSVGAADYRAGRVSLSLDGTTKYGTAKEDE